jgi:hypothetical protein
MMPIGKEMTLKTSRKDGRGYQRMVLAWVWVCLGMDNIYSYILSVSLHNFTYLTFLFFVAFLYVYFLNTSLDCHRGITGWSRKRGRGFVG